MGTGLTLSEFLTGKCRSKTACCKSKRVRRSIVFLSILLIEIVTLLSHALAANTYIVSPGRLVAGDNAVSGGRVQLRIDEADGRGELYFLENNGKKTSRIGVLSGSVLEGAKLNAVAWHGPRESVIVLVVLGYVAANDESYLLKIYELDEGTGSLIASIESSNMPMLTHGLQGEDKSDKLSIVVFQNPFSIDVSRTLGWPSIASFNGSLSLCSASKYPAIIEKVIASTEDALKEYREACQIIVDMSCPYTDIIRRLQVQRDMLQVRLPN